jgi:hypothetical protein
MTFDTSDMPLNLPAAAAAYLLQATESLIAEQGVDVRETSREEMDAWLDSNFAAIAARASDLQDEMFVKFQRHQQLITDTMIISVYHTVRRQDINSSERAAYLKLFNSKPWERF